MAEPRSSGQGVTPWLVVVLVVVLFSGGLFGYDQGVISGALHGIKARFSLSPLLLEVVTSWVTLGALFCIIAWVWIYFRVPETKGQSLEQIQQFWKEPA